MDYKTWIFPSFRSRDAFRPIELERKRFFDYNGRCQFKPIRIGEKFSTLFENSGDLN